MMMTPVVEWFRSPLSGNPDYDYPGNLSYLFLLLMLIPTIVWNCQGAGTKTFARYLETLISLHNLKILILVETRICGVRADRLIKRLRFDKSHRVEAQGFSGGIWIMWKHELSITILQSHWQFIHLRIQRGGQASFAFTAVYGSPNPLIRRHLWENLETLALQTSGPWLIAGDFNALIHSTDKLGGSRPAHICKRFLGWIHRTGLAELAHIGPSFTWSRGLCHERLDRALINADWGDFLVAPKLTHLAKVYSDHCPLLLDIDVGDAVQPKPKFFKLLSAWETHSDWQKFVKECWDDTKPLHEALTLFSDQATKWNREVFGNIFHRKRRILARLRGIQKAFETHISGNLLLLDKELRIELENILLQEDLLWHQRANADWSMLGDRNTTVFHRRVSTRKRRMRILGLFISSGTWCEDQTILEQEALSFFREVYRGDSSNGLPYDIRNKFPPIPLPLSTAMSRPVSDEEVRTTVLAMSPNKAPGIDGIPTFFFQKNWNVVGGSLCNMVKACFTQGVMDTSINKSLITLIPKMENPERFNHFRPISLCNVSYKIITKIVANRLKCVMSHLVNPAQTSFVEGRHITDNILIAQELLHSMRTVRGRKGWLAVKIDLEKAYDRLSWNFIKDTLREANIPDGLSNIILTSLSSSSFQLLWNGNVSESFIPSRGVRQGDPISPYIFVLCMERLSHAIMEAVNQGDWIAPTFGPEVCISHLFFADDLILFAEATEGQANVLYRILDSFCDHSGHKISYEKSQLFFSPNVDPFLAENIARKLNISITEDLGRYLGVPLLHGRVLKTTYNALKQKVQAQAQKWNPSNISLAGRITLSRSTLASIPLYTMQTSLLPKGLCDDLDKICRGFLWGSSNGSRKSSLVAWDKVCQPRKNGGLGMRNMYDMNRSFIMKLGWELITNPKALWVKLMRAKYGIPDDTIPYELTPGKCSHAWRNICKIWSRLLEGLNWAIGNGHTIRFWLDRWVGGVKPLIELTTIPILESRRGDTLCSYVNEFGGWCWADFEAYLPAEVLLRIAAIPPPIPQSSDEDSVFWSHSDSGKFSTYSAYTSLTHMPWSVGNAGWKMIWKCAVPERVRTFLWLAFNDALLTNEVRHRRHMIDFDGCDQCGGDSESLNHILRECPQSNLLSWDTFSQ
ncbi:hypothetical protein Syun_001714 [Stephania yunnanensis]|uniref:Reverse transcriptase domain-containing protein n=1 Tax=Stephania yunnanensis TaxID=152371 RepID=A0AAP0LID5_9MAGN